jgi:hypothetical protein
MLSAGCSLLRFAGFSCILDAVHGGLGINNWKFLTKKYKFFFSCKILNFQFKTLDPDQELPKCWIQIQIGIRIEILADPQHYLSMEEKTFFDRLTKFIYWATSCYSQFGKRVSINLTLGGALSGGAKNYRVPSFLFH